MVAMCKISPFKHLISLQPRKTASISINSQCLSLVDFFGERTILALATTTFFNPQTSKVCNRYVFTWLLHN